jgi:hypothetical protein
MRHGRRRARFLPKQAPSEEEPVRIRGTAPTTIWRCEHLYPVVVERTERGKRARCLGCGQSGPVRADSSGAMQALRGERVYAEKVTA